MASVANMNSMLGLTPEEMEIARKQKYAEALRKQSDEPMQGQMVSGHYVAPSWTQGLAKMLSAYGSGRMEREAGDLQKQFGEKQRADLQQVASALMGTPEQKAAYQADNPFGEDLGNLQTVTPAHPGNRQAAMAMALKSSNPALQQFALQEMFAQPKQAEAFTLGEGQVRYGPNGEVLATGPDKRAQTSSIGQLIAERDSLPANDPRRALYDNAIKKATTHQPGVQVSYGAPVAGVDAQGNPVFFQPDKGGGAPAIIPGVAPSPKPAVPPSEGERSASGYLGRMQAAEKLLSGLSGGEQTVGTSVAGAVPLVGDYLQRKSMTDKQQQYKQAADDWIRAKLRKESGAVIGEDEMKREYQTYFPQPGDGDKVKAQKAQARKQAERQMKIGAGRAYTKRIDDLWSE